jgi:hypothetical protein
MPARSKGKGGREAGFMASERRRGATGGRQQVIEEDVPVAAPLEETRGKDRGPKKQAGGFPGAMPVIAGAAAGALAFLAVIVVGGQMGAKDPYAGLDAGGVQAARLLGAMPIDHWKTGMGSTGAVRAAAKKVTEQKKTEARASGEETAQFEEALIQWYQGVNAPGAKWRMGLDMVFPPNDPGDAKAIATRDNAFQNAQQGDAGAFLGAMIKVGEKEVLFESYPPGLPALPGGPPVKQVGPTKVHEFAFKGRPARWYEHPTVNRLGAPEGTAVVILSTASVEAFPLIPLGGAAGGLAFLGGFLLATILSGGTKSALGRLAHDTDALAKGFLDTKVGLEGPGVVQHIGKNVQKIAALAASGAAAEPQVVVQEVVRAPTQEINEALAPSKSFQRPDELEIEATQKVAADGGNDFYDVVNVDDERVGVFIADAPARGVKSSMHMAAIRALFRASYRGQGSPAEVLKAVNRGFAIDLPRGVYVTAMYAVVEKSTGVCKVASAQHMPLVFYKMSKKASARLSPEGIALGLDPGPVFDKTLSEKAVQLEKGDRIVLFTDGAINAKRPDGAQYGEEKFYYVVNKEAPKNSAACVNFVANDVDLFHEGAPLADDFTIVTVRKLR